MDKLIVKSDCGRDMIATKPESSADALDVTADDPTPKKVAEVHARERKTDHAIPCPECQRDSAFVVSTRSHPAFVEVRQRRYKCRLCGHAFKRLK